MKVGRCGLTQEWAVNSALHFFPEPLQSFQQSAISCLYTHYERQRPFTVSPKPEPHSTSRHLSRYSQVEKSKIDTILISFFIKIPDRKNFGKEGLFQGLISEVQSRVSWLHCCGPKWGRTSWWQGMVEKVLKKGALRMREGMMWGARDNI